MLFIALAVASSLAAVPTPSTPQTLEKNGLPCVAEICIGDGLAELSKIQWNLAHNPVKVGNTSQPTSTHALRDDDLRAINSLFPGAAEAAPYLHQRQFDSGALAALSRVSTACQSNELVGSFGAANTPTKVRISLMPSLTNPAKLAWTVTNVVREFPTASNIDERTQLNRMLNKKYAKFAAEKIDSGKTGEGYYSPSATTHFGFALSLSRAADEGKRMQDSPACSGV